MPVPFCRDPALAQLRQALAERAAGHFWIPINPPGRSVGPTDPGAPARAGISGRADRAAPSARHCKAAVCCTEGHRRVWLPLRPDGVVLDWGGAAASARRAPCWSCRTQASAWSAVPG